MQTIGIHENGCKLINEGKANIVDRSLIESFGKVAIVKKDTGLSRIFIAEGVETAASVASIIDGNFIVLASLGITEFKHAIAYIKMHCKPGADSIELKKRRYIDSMD